MDRFVEIKQGKAGELMKLLGFSSKSGTLIYGREKLLEYLKHRNHDAKVIFLSEDVQLKYQDMWLRKAEYHGALIYKLNGYSMVEIGERLGKRKLSAFATTDRNILNGVIGKAKD